METNIKCWSTINEFSTTLCSEKSIFTDFQIFPPPDTLQPPHARQGFFFKNHRKTSKNRRKTAKIAQDMETSEIWQFFKKNFPNYCLIQKSLLFRRKNGEIHI